MVEPNVTMLRNLVSNIEKTAPLQTVSLMQGYKVYGAHLGPFKTPARESDPGVPGPNLTPLSSRGSAISARKNVALECHQAGRGGQPGAGQCHESCAEHRAVCLAVQSAGFTAAFPRFGTNLAQHRRSYGRRLLAEATLWAATSPRRKIRRSTSITAISGAGASCGRASHAGLNWIRPPVRLSFHQLFVDYRAHWRELAGQSLVEADILRLSDGKFADFVFGWNYDMFGDGSKLRRAGFTEMQATDEMFFRLFAQLRAARIIP
jgi:hypothetical protein